MPALLGIGLMSGTSGDGIDSALVRFDRGKITLEALDFLSYPAPVRKEIFAASAENGPASLVCDLNVRLGKLFGAAAIRLAKKSGTSFARIAFIGSHGQTVRHQPAHGKKKITSTLQIGEAAEISRITGCVVVSDFRPADIAAGGCGAPLAPLAHFVMFANRRENRVVHNLGGISNISWIPASCSLGEVFGFDTGPANMLLDLAVARFTGGRAAFDHGGKMALRGTVSPRLFSYCMADPYFSRRPPKSTGREMFGLEYFDRLMGKFPGIEPNDFLRTLAAVTALSSVGQVYRFIKPKKALRWIVCGGGAYNGAVMKELRKEVEARGGSVTLSGELGFPEKSVEPVLMAILANRTLKGLPGNLPQVTGAVAPVVLGKISLP